MHDSHACQIKSGAVPDAREPIPNKKAATQRPKENLHGYTILTMLLVHLYLAFFMNGPPIGWSIHGNSESKMKQQHRHDRVVRDTGTQKKLVAFHPSPRRLLRLQSRTCIRRGQWGNGQQEFMTLQKTKNKTHGSQDKKSRCLSTYQCAPSTIG
jgi:hypothetical protein